MGKRNVYYYSLELKTVKGNKDVTKNLKQIYDDIFNTKAVVIDGTKTLKLQNGQVTLDILKNSDEYLFGRVGKETEHYNIVKRNKETMKSQSVLNSTEINEVLEACTYFLLDYAKGIVGFVFGKPAPTPNALINIITDYNDEHIMNIDRIASPESVRALFKPDSKLKKFKYIVRTPNIEILEALKIRDSVKRKMIGMKKQEIEIIIKNGNKSMFDSVNEMKEFITDIFAAEEKENISLFGNSGKSKQKEFKFLEQDISYPIEIKEYNIENSIKKRLDNEEIHQNVYNELKAVYNSHYKDIIRFAGKDYEDGE